MRIMKLTFWPVSLVARHTAPCARTLIRLDSDLGLSGWGEAPGTAGEERQRTIQAALLGADVLDFESIRAVLSPGGAGPAPWVAALETAVLDLRGKASGEPVYRLLGGQVRNAVTLTEPPPTPRPAESEPASGRPTTGDPLLRALSAVQTSAPGASTRVDFHELGGFGPTRAVAEVAGRAGGALSLAGGPETGVSLAARLHLAASHPAIHGALESGYFRLTRDVLRFGILRDTNGRVRVPAGTGLGVQPDLKRVRALTLEDDAAESNHS